MVLITTINSQECGWEIVKIGTKKECLEELQKLQKQVWFDENGNQKLNSCIYDDTRSKNAKLITNTEAIKLFGGKAKFEHIIDCMFEMNYLDTRY